VGYPPTNATTDIKVLDHGYAKLIESWGADERIIEAARMSTDKGFLGWGDDSACRYGVHADGSMCKKGVFGCDVEHKIGDEKLLKYLWENKHATPFEMAGLVIEVQAPIFVFREWHRHRTQSYSELSARYTPLPDVNYVPSVERLMHNVAGGNKQAGTIKGADELTVEKAREFQLELAAIYKHAEDLYRQALAFGVPKELARVHLPVGRYSRMRASANLRNWCAFLTLRTDKAAQWEIQQFANAVADLLRERFPRTMRLFDEERK
jgi:thymidylate synthase (FAD)